VSKDLYFAAAQPRSPDCEDVGMFRNSKPIKETKTWMVLGGDDDFTRAEPCVDLGKKIKIKGGDIEVTVKKDGIITSLVTGNLNSHKNTTGGNVPIGILKMTEP